MGVTGSTLPPAASKWLQDNLGDDVRICGVCGGTDVVSAFMAGAPTVPVWPGELSAPCLGVAVDAYDELDEDELLAELSERLRGS